MGLVSGIKKALSDSKNKSVDKANDIMGRVVPGYNYHKREVRLSTDASVRDKLSRETAKSRRLLKEIGELAYKEGLREEIEHIKDATSTLEMLGMELDTAEYGNSPFFKEEGVGFNDVRSMIEFDASLFDGMEVLTEACDLLYKGVLDGKTSDFILQVRKIKKNTDNLRNRFMDRRDFLLRLS